MQEQIATGDAGFWVAISKEQQLGITLRWVFLILMAMSPMFASMANEEGSWKSYILSLIITILTFSLLLILLHVIPVYVWQPVVDTVSNAIESFVFWGVDTRAWDY